ncbi:deleted in malignant brain tumors 1 protein-like [Pristis pectinata]|uniref:deleted in malignant brain tumors 1 protein-like n=1 Tax=Pristis pectinata TaxID=685728 RepID=UPI00223E1B42|nr:deleted in malignant brain tumors 1 protein-like [Pristis pectinata]
MKFNVSESVKLRLVNGGSRCAGRLEVHYKGKWWAVHAYGWDLQDAAVVCRELGCGAALKATGGAQFGAGSGPVMTSNVQCSGSEAALRECRSGSWDSYASSSSNKAGVICTGELVPRLVGGKNRCSGRVEVLHAEQWGTLCDEYFTLEDAAVVCEHLQCGAVKATLGGAHFGEGTGPVWKEQYLCRGNESRLSDCPVSDWGQISCSHRNDAGLICSGESPKSLRLVNGGSRCAGRLEVHHKGIWGTVYAYGWELQDAAVVCRELGCGAALKAPGGAQFGAGSGTVMTSNVQCSGSEAALRECRSGSWGRYAYSSSNNAGVICTSHRVPRLVSGADQCSGRLEVQIGETWGTVCDRHWDMNKANVVCSQLQCGVALSVPRRAHFGEGTGLIHSDVFQCKGNESNLSDCLVSSGTHHCKHSDDVSVICSGTNGPRLVGGKDRCSGRVEVQHGDQWGTLCDVYFSLEDAAVVCEHLQCGAVNTTLGGAHFDEGSGPMWKEQYLCRGNESRLSDCPVSDWGQISCSHRNDAGLFCTDADWSLRLDNGGSRCDGRVEIYYNGRWGRVQDNFWNINDSNVVCSQLGCGSAISAYNYSSCCPAARPSKTSGRALWLEATMSGSKMYNCLRAPRPMVAKTTCKYVCPGVKIHVPEDWKFITMVLGEQFAMTSGI